MFFVSKSFFRYVFYYFPAFPPNRPGHKRLSKSLLKVNDTVAPLGTCDITFSLASNSHGNFYIKIACLSKQRVHFS